MLEKERPTFCLADFRLKTSECSHVRPSEAAVDPGLENGGAINDDKSVLEICLRMKASRDQLLPRAAFASDDNGDRGICEIFYFAAQAVDRG